MSKTLLSAPLATLEQGDDFIRRHGVVRVICENSKHKQRQG